MKSYANLVSNSAKGVQVRPSVSPDIAISESNGHRQLSAVKTAPTAWQWEYESQSSGIRADVSYDIWLGTAPSGDPASRASSYEIMIWLSGLGGYVYLFPTKGKGHAC